MIPPSHSGLYRQADHCVFKSVTGEQIHPKCDKTSNVFMPVSNRIKKMENCVYPCICVTNGIQRDLQNCCDAE